MNVQAVRTMEFFVYSREVLRVKSKDSALFENELRVIESEDGEAGASLADCPWDGRRAAGNPAACLPIGNA